MSMTTAIENDQQQLVDDETKCWRDLEELALGEPVESYIVEALERLAATRDFILKYYHSAYDEGPPDDHCAPAWGPRR